MAILNPYDANLALSLLSPVSAFGVGRTESSPIPFHYVNGAFIASLKNLNI